MNRIINKNGLIGLLLLVCWGLIIRLQWQILPSAEAGFILVPLLLLLITAMAGLALSDQDQNRHKDV